MGVEKTQPRKAINKKNKTRLVFDESARKEFLTGFRKRKDERRKQWKEKVDRQLKNEIKKIKGENQAKVRTIYENWCQVSEPKVYCFPEKLYYTNFHISNFI